MDDEDKYTDQLREMIDNRDFQQDSQANPHEQSYTDMAGQIWKDGSVVKSNEVETGNYQLYDQVRSSATKLMSKDSSVKQNPNGFSDQEIVNYLQGAGRNGGVQPKISADDVTEMKAKWASDSAYFLNRDIVTTGAHGPLTNKDDQKAIAEFVNKSSPAELIKNDLPPNLSANREDGLELRGNPNGSRRGSRGLGISMSKDEKRIYDIQKANEFLTLQSPNMDKIAQTVYDRIQKDPNLSKNIASNLDGALGEAIKKIGDQAPNKLAKTEFNARAAQFRVDWASKAQSAQYNIDQEKFQSDIAGQGQFLAQQASQDHQHEQKLIMDAYNSTGVALRGGMKPDQAQRHLQKTILDIKQGSVNNLIQVAPELAMKRLQSGDYDALGPGVMKSMRMAQAALDARSKQISSSLSKRESDIVSGKYTDYQLEDPRNYAPRDQNRIAAYNNLVAKASETRALTSNELTTLAQTSDDPMRRKLARSALDQIHDDPTTYAYKQGIVERVVLDGSPESAQKFTENHHRIKSVLGLPDNGPMEANPLPKDNVSAVINTLSSGNTENIVKTVNYINAFGDLAPNIINQIGRAQGGEIIKLFANQTDKRTIADIATGYSAKGILPNIGKGDRKEDTFEATKQSFDIKPKVIGNSNYLYSQDPNALKAIQYGAVGSTLSRNGENASLQDFQANVDKVSGAVTLQSAGNWFGSDDYKTIPIKGMSASDMHSTIKGLTNDDFKQYGNSASPKDGNQKTTPYASDGYPVNFKDISPDRFQYIPIKYGQYALLKDGSPLRTSDGEIYTINLDAYNKDKNNQ